MSTPDLSDADIAAVTTALQQGNVGSGPNVRAFEHTFTTALATPHAVGVSSGTSGLHLCVIAAGVGERDLVITTPFSFIASANCILYERAIPIFVDVERTSGNIDPALVAQAADDLARGGAAATRWLPPALRERQASLGRLRAVLPVHAFGQPADMHPLQQTAQQHNLAVIEDACEALGSHYHGQAAGTLGDAAVFAFYPNKQITTGEGGMIVTRHTAWADLFRSLRNQGRDTFNEWLDHNRLGYNYRLDEMSAALGTVQMQRLDELLAKRAQVAQWYSERLADLPHIETPRILPATTRMSWFVYVIRVRPPASRNALMQQLQAAGIPSRPYFTPIHLQTFYRQQFGYQRGDFPITEELGDSSLALPFSGVMTEEQVASVCESIGTHLRNTVSVSAL
jgi:dTDP-4-amino-4,6-dideoxygalactose transaminase